jgi:hypothetical protein
MNNNHNHLLFDISKNLDLPLKEWLIINRVQKNMKKEFIENELFDTEYLHHDLDNFLNFQFSSEEVIYLKNEYSESILKKSLNNGLDETSKTLSIKELYEFCVLILFELYKSDTHPNFYLSETYKKEYSNLKDYYLKNNIDTNEIDFIDIELNKCFKISAELSKPMFSAIEKNIEFKIILERTINKRIEFLRNKKTKPLEKEGPHLDIFKDDEAFSVFKQWMNFSHKDSQEKKISFIIKKLEKEGRLRITNFKDISNWAFENEFINQTTYDLMKDKGYFLSPSKMLTASRLAIYEAIIDS